MELDMAVLERFRCILGLQGASVEAIAFARTGAQR